jgi:hypothetical protein
VRQDPPKPKSLLPAVRHADPGEPDAQDPQDLGDADRAEPAHRTAKRGRRARRSDSEASYLVGYGRPPTHSQFKPGQSGNPKGRLPRTRNLKTVVQQVVEEQIQLREGGKSKRMSKFEALLRTLISRAFKGDTKAVASIIAIMKHFGYGTEIAEVGPELPANVDYDAVVQEFLSRAGREDSTGDDCSSEDLAEQSGPVEEGKP